MEGKKGAKEKEKSGILRHPKKRAFLAAFAEVGTVLHAARAAGIDRDTHYTWLKTDPEYPAHFEQAQAAAAESLEREALRRAVEGFEEDVWYQGKKVGTRRKYSDVLLIFLLKGALPEKYKERISTQVEGRVKIKVEIPQPQALPQAATGTTIDVTPQAQALPAAADSD